VDQADIINDEDANVEYEVWDRESSINGVAAADILSSRANDIPPGGVIYLVKDRKTGRVLYFQPFKPGEAGRQSMTRAEAETIGESHRSDVANDRATCRIIDEVNKQLDS
jgi:hypothetical protein